MAKMSRSVPFIDRLPIAIQGNVTTNAICLQDVDNDKCFELCVGDSRGNLSIYKVMLLTRGGSGYETARKPDPTRTFLLGPKPDFSRISKFGPNPKPENESPTRKY